MPNNFSTKYDYRFDPFLETVSTKAIVDEDKVVPSSSPFYINLEEVPYKETPSSITAYDVTLGLTLSEVTSTPGSNEFQVDWKYLTGKVRFNSAQGGNTIRFNYKGTGHSVAATFLNVLANWIGAGYTLMDNHSHDGSNSAKVIGTADNTITGAMMVAGAVNTDQIQLDAVTSEKIQDGAVSQSKLKTFQGEVTLSNSSTMGKYQTSILPGGEYGFYPRIKTTDDPRACIAVRIFSYDMSTGGGQHPGATYTTLVTIMVRTTNTASGIITGYVQQTYVTSSGPDHWIFLLIDKETKKIISGWQAPDHPCYGQDDDENKMPHPFLSYDETKHEVILVDNEILIEFKPKISRKKSMLTLIHEEYEVDYESSPVYEAREIIEIDEWGDRPGEVIGEYDTPDWARIKIKKDKFTLKKRKVKTLPSMIKYKKLKLKGGVK